VIATTPVELDHADLAQFKAFQQELARAARGEIPAEWIRRSFEALPAEVQAIFIAQQGKSK
jgi:hypothetical protein